MPEVDYRVDWHDDLVIFTLSAEKRLNALSLTMVDGMEKCLDAMSAKGVRAIVITGLGKAFCAGTDLHEASELSHDEQCDKAGRIRELFFRLQTMPLTGIAAINGHALGGGLGNSHAIRASIGRPSMPCPGR
jgi:enoyl-CoA hydratase